MLRKGFITVTFTFVDGINYCNARKINHHVLSVVLIRRGRDVQRSMDFLFGKGSLV